ncbi:MAG: TraR/DksA family transcriptional regulator [Candidatus Brocadia sp. AMX2]|uniref:DnaK suppressor protein n=1 Tax=Candidatus Brocadia sinica JPN1 TaxID=1197129 RepID=A0ABQ0JVF5_9BACT|nr:MULTISPECIES: TraR/DksA family transcriptional regulator [Brocadia]KXK30096.1 MAG: DNA-binding protein [Candidatus Brocadia sinica]MBC6930832.1 TraR/DksA family transcriptional regulator [Candidatus Brocadia sp.]MBL1167801.1 TraR/DksA family transcriptional regulator [Candidatus Brocadia sp. AMX1]NOG41415.1 TraR/DksA family transcriptional regulator [Planctomycetota bacterium]KAA0245530.1 MAG: TraR/DksA family transcriptional regulator [Candidatus Brocadia sp. AMX2]
MQKKELKQMENVLLNRKEVLLRELEERVEKYRDTNSGKMTDIAEIASSSSTDELEITVAEEDARELKQIEDALARIRAGHYGVCEQCGQMIKKARLKAIPFATLCVSCKEEEEREYDEKATQMRYDAEDIIDKPEHGETDEIDRRYLGKKIIELERDDNRN